MPVILMKISIIFGIIILLLVFLCTVDPFICPHQQVDKGAIKFILSGAHIMCPGLTSPGTWLILSLSLSGHRCLPT